MWDLSRNNKRRKENNHCQGLRVRKNGERVGQVHKDSIVWDEDVLRHSMVTIVNDIVLYTRNFPKLILN